METTNISTGVNSLSTAKFFRVVIANDPNYFTSEKHNRVINGFTTEKAATDAAFAAAEEIAKSLCKGAAAVYSETLSAFVVWSGKRYFGRVILITAKVEEVESTPTAPETETTTNTETAMQTIDTTNNVTNAYEETHAARCLHIYLNNTSEIYSRFTVPAIEYAAGLAAFGWEFVADALSNGAKDRGVKIVDEALTAAARLVQKHDHMTPTAADVEHVKANYVAYIIECAQYEVANA